MRLIGLLMVICVCVATHAQSFLDRRSDWQKKELKGSVRTIKTYEVRKLDFLTAEELKVFQQRGQKPPYYKKVWTNTLDFNRMGYIMKSRCPESWTGDNYDMTYNAANQPLCMIRYKDDGSINNSYKFTYDKHGFILYAERRNNESVIFKEFYTCDNKGNLLRMIHKNEDGGSSENIFEYQNCKLSKWTITDNEQPYQTMIFDGSIDRLKELYVWNGKHCDHIRISINSAGLPEMTKKETEYGGWYIYVQRSFDSQNNIIKEIFYNVDGSVSNEKTFSYKYDSYGNWIRKESKGKGTFDNRIEEREIIYY